MCGSTASATKRDSNSVKLGVYAKCHLPSSKWWTFSVLEMENEKEKIINMYT